MRFLENLRHSAFWQALALALWVLVLPACIPQEECPLGELGCACFEDDTCGEQGGSRLLCESSLCVSDACIAGTEGCSCGVGETCASGSFCHGGLCVKGNCTPGQAGCPCAAEGACAFGSCISGFCVAGEALTPPPAPKCYTPCQSGLVAADGYTACPDDGLMPRCLDGKQCVQGSCVDPGVTTDTCSRDVDCPDFQTCIQGSCYSNCDSNDDCMGGRQCHRHVCRTPCDASLDSCPTSTACFIENGDSGFCMPLRPSSANAASITTAEGSFELSSSQLSFSSTRTSARVVLTNHGPSALEFKIRKLDHRERGDQGEVRIADAPLGWVSMGHGSSARVAEFSVVVDGNGGSVELTFATAANPTLAQWEGRIEVESAVLGRKLLHLSYVSRPEGQWTGKMYSFANFADSHLSDWIAHRDDAGALARVGNAFVQRWGALRQGRLSLDEFQAVLASTISESWRWESTRQGCTEAAACYPYSSTTGLRPYSDSLESFPIPTALSELPISLNLQVDPAEPQRLRGKIVTAGALHYAGDPSISIAFVADPSTCKPGIVNTCLAPLSELSATIRVGGRYETVKGDITCARTGGLGFSQVAVPWLVPGFTEHSDLDPDTGLRYRYECRDQQLPLGSDPANRATNLSFAQSNPIPDGRPRVRQLELVDGALINQQTLIVIYRERFTESFLGTTDTQGFSAYGVMILNRQPADLDEAAYLGASVVDHRAPPDGVLGNACDDAIVRKFLGPGVPLSQNNAAVLATGVLDGVAPGPAPQPLNAASSEQVHYLCHDSGLFDGGPQDFGTQPLKLRCREGSGVTWFTTQTSLSQQALAQLSCQSNGTCQETLNLWAANRAHGIRLHPVWRCSDPNRAYCDDDRADLRAGKIFYPSSSATAVYVPLQTAIDAAFRYKTQFRGRDGSSVGFTPSICVPNSNALPYCYDPVAIEDARARSSCALDVYSRFPSSLPVALRERLKAFLIQSFGYVQDNSPTGIVVRDGFERLNAELLIMQGDEAYTQAFASRFDLAGSRMVSFPGTLFEPDGINLAGGAGNEMYRLYLATQYYQMVLDRFYALSPQVWQSVQDAPSASFISKETVVGYFDKLIRASTQKARAWSEVSKRYQSFNRPDLARHVVQRAYSAAYLESIVLSRMILRVVAVADPADRAFLTGRAELASLGYRAALLDMREVYANIQNDRTMFGDAPDFIPFPALEAGDVNAFSKLLAAAEQSVALAAKKEEVALNSSRSFDVDAVEFQGELIRIRSNYENQLGELCGTFRGDDGRIYPAVSDYAHLNAVTRLMGNPCGLVGNGRVHDAVGAVEMTALDLRSVSRRYDNIFEEMQIETRRVEAQCGLTFSLADYRYDLAGKVQTLEAVVLGARSTQSAVGRASKAATDIAMAFKCGVADCATGAAAAAVTTTQLIISEAATQALDVAILLAEWEIDSLQREAGVYEAGKQCEAFMVDSRASIDRLSLELKVLELEALKSDYRLRLDLSQIQKLRNDATRLAAEKAEMEAQTISVEAARNDPNVRIYKNDAVILADQTFTRAVKDAYRATRVYEYYTSQSYAKLEQLFMIRMVSHGDYNLETYLVELQAGYREFQQSYGNPDTRIEVVSLRDDVFAIPRMDATGRSLSQSERTALFREKLGDASFIDERGYLSLPFATSVSRLSPLTRNHKVLAIESELIGTDLGDSVARLYVRQRGTGTVHSIAGAKIHYRLPERTAVLNPFANGVRAYSPEVYRSERLRDRPFANTHWELVVNQKDEQANKDIRLQSLTDIRLYVYYSDFTRL